MGRMDRVHVAVHERVQSRKKKGSDFNYILQWLTKKMLVGSVVGGGLCLLLGVAHPVTAASHAVAREDSVAVARWLAFFTCAALMVLPLACLPAWTPLRLEAMLGALLLLGASDARGAAVVHARYLQPLFSPVERAMAHLRKLSCDECLNVVERAVSTRMRCCAESATSEVVEDPKSM